MSELYDIKTAAEKILEQDNILIVSHKNPDGDTLGSSSALCHGLISLGKKAAVICNDEIPTKYSYMNIPLYKKDFEPQYIISSDVASTQLFGEEVSEYSKRINLAIDHHPSNTGFADYMLLDGNAAATCEITYELLVEMGVSISPVMADCIYTGVSTDTGCFKFANTNAKTHFIAASVMERGANFAMLNSLLFESKSKKRLEVEKEALATLRYFYDERVAVIYVLNETIERIDIDSTDLEGITAIPRMIEGVDVGVTLRQLKGGSYKVSVRTTDAVDASIICARLGGGGHKRASGCEVFGGLENVIGALLTEIAKEI